MKTGSPAVTERKMARQDRIARKERIAQDKVRAKLWDKQRLANSRLLVVAQAVKLTPIRNKLTE